MNILNKITIKNIKLNKKRNIGTIIGILLSTALICAVAGMVTSFHQTLVQNAINETGYYHIELEDISNEKFEEVSLNRDMCDIKARYELGYSLFEHEGNKDEIEYELNGQEYELVRKLINNEVVYRIYYEDDHKDEDLFLVAFKKVTLEDGTIIYDRIA